MKSFNCLACGSQMKPLSEVKDPFSKIYFKLVVCSSCRMVRVRDIPVELEMFYTNESGSTMRSKPNPLSYSARNFLFGMELNRILNQFNSNDKILDLGCGDGSLVDFLSKSFSKVHASDVYPSGNWEGSIKYAQIDPQSNLPPMSFCLDTKIVTMRHVFEHVPDPYELLVNLKSLGIENVIVIVPNRDSVFAKLFKKYWYYWDPPRHLTHFSKKSLRILGDRVGYSTSSSVTHGIDEIVVTAYTFLLNKNKSKFASVFKPTGLLSSVASMLMYPVSRGVIVHHFVLRESSVEN